jgi:8-oxo-dGTP pyrophosphatase MutT (NUDIX family)
MGMLCCAKDASVLCSVENLFKKFMPHLVIKGMTQEKVNARFDSFAKRAKRLGLKILSIDMSAMDSSWTMKDRARVRKVLQSVIDVVQELLDAELQLDYVSQCFAKKRALRWILRYLTVQLSAEDSILFSGERLTSIGNRILMLIIWSAELLRRYGSGDGEKRIEQMFYCPPTRFADMPDEPPVGIAEPVPINDDDFPDDPRYDNNIGDGDDCTLAIAQDMYASEEDFVRAYERSHKLVEPCSAWDEGTDLECLSTMAIAAGSGEHHKRYYVPKVQRNAQRLIAHKIRVPPAKHIAEGNPTYTPTKTEYSEICTDLWLRSFALRHSMVVRHLNRAMFEYCFSKCRDCKTKYDQDLHRLGKTDGDYRLADCLEQVRENARQDVCAFAMVKATNFKTMSTLSVSQVKALKAEWFESDDSWSNLELTDDLCARPDVLLTNFPVGTGVAAALGFRQELVAQLERQLVKPQGAGPDMRDGTRPGSTEVSRADGSGEADGDKIVRAASVMVYQDFAVLCGYEPRGKPREGMLTFPGGKLDKNESFEEAAIRELEEEAGVTTSKMSLEFVREFQCGHIQCKQYCVNANTTSPMTVLHADRLTDLKFRTAKEILMDHPLSKIAKCVREVIRLETLSDASTAYFYSQPGGSVSFRDHPPFRSGLQTPASAGSGPAGTAPGPQTLPGSSGDLVLRPSFEVKAGTAEVHAMGPPHPDEFKHTHFCQSCDTEYSHSHRHTPGVEHKQRKGDCPNPKCSYHKRVSNSGAGAHTSREPEEIRQPPASSPIIGCGTADSRKSEGKGRAGDTSASLSTSSVSQNAGKSHAGAAESKRNRSANRREGKGGKGNRAVPSTSRDQGTARAKEPKTVAQPTPDGPRATRRPKFADDGTAQTAASAMTLAPQPPSGPPVANPMACDSEAPRLFGFPGLSCARVPDARAASADFLASMAVIGSMMPHPPGIFSAADGTLLPPPPPPPPVIPEPSSGTLARAVSPTGIERAGISGHQQPDGDVTHPTTRRPGSQGV